MTGQMGSDLYRFEKLTDSAVGAMRDQITDFSAGSAGTSIDKIDLGPIDAKSDVAGNQEFTFIGASAFSGISGQLQITLSGTTTIVSGDTNGDSEADFQIALLNFTDLATLTSIDFIR